MRTITIIGGGASGTLLACNLLTLPAKEPFKIALVEKRERFGRGVAYSTDKESHVLNVPAGKMGAFPDNLEHFHRWLGEKGYSFAPSDFVPRRFFGEYLQSVFDEAVRSKLEDRSIELHDDEAVDISLSAHSAVVELRSGQNIKSDRVVLAFGNFLPPHPTVPDQTFTEAPRYFQDPWRMDIYDAIGRDETVFIVGTGLTMVDVVLHLHRVGHRGSIDAISTRGLLPSVHKLGFHYPDFFEEIRPMRRITDILKVVRRHISAAEADSSDWRAVIDSLRPHTQEIWLNLPTSEKRYFMQHLSRYWNVARHRISPQAADVLEEMQASGSLDVLKGRLRNITFRNDVFEIAFSADGAEAVTQADVLINCIGSESNFERLNVPLVKNLLSKGLVSADDVRLGLKATPDGNIIDQRNNSSKVIRTLGTALKGTLWETTAIPEIRTQARSLAAALLDV